MLLTISSWSAVLFIKIIILIYFVHQCSNYNQLNYDLKKTYSTLTRIGLSQLIFATVFIILYLIYVIDENKLLEIIALFFSGIVATLHSIFFVLRLRMTFLHSSYQLSKCALVCYAILCILSLLAYVFYRLIDEDMLILGHDDEISLALLPIMFITAEILNLLIIFLVSFQFVHKLISLAIKHYSPSLYELQAANLMTNGEDHMANQNININNSKQLGEISSVELNAMDNNNNINTGININTGGSGIIRIEKTNDTRNTIPFSVIQIELIKAVSKQTVLQLMDFIGVAIHAGLYIIASNNSTIKNIYYGIGPFEYVTTSLAIWLSFEFADKQYKFLCGKCDSCCLNCAKKRIKKLENNQERVEEAQQRFSII